MAVVIGSINLKGGVGKTSLAKNMGIIYANEGKRVLIIDLCQNSGVLTRFGYDRYTISYDSRDFISGFKTFDQVVVHDEETGVDILPGSNQVDKIQQDAEKNRPIGVEFVIKDAIEKIKDRYDYIFIDTHPTETNKLVIMAMLASDFVCIPCDLDAEAIVQTERTHTLLQQLRKQNIHVDYKVVMLAVHTSRSMIAPLEAEREKFKQKGIPVADTNIRYSTTVKKDSLEDLPEYKKKSKFFKAVMDDYKKLAEELKADLVVKG